MLLLALDIGGSTTRAAVLTPAGQCIGYGRSGSGNPVSSGIEAASESHERAINEAYSSLGIQDREQTQLVLIAAAGVSRHARWPGVSRGLGRPESSFQQVIESDLLAMFFSSTHHSNGVVLSAGTGAIGAVVKDGRLSKVADGLGWLMGDYGSGLWIGRQCLSAVSDDLSGRSLRTELTRRVISHFDLGESADASIDPGVPVPRQRTLQALINAVYSRPPISLAELAPLVFASASSGDVVAHHILAAAAEELHRTLELLHPGPWVESEQLILGGSILQQKSVIRKSITSTSHPVRPRIAGEGIIGACVLALMASGKHVSKNVFEAVKATVTAASGKSA